MAMSVYVLFFLMFWHLHLHVTRRHDYNFTIQRLYMYGWFVMIMNRSHFEC